MTAQGCFIRNGLAVMREVAHAFRLPCQLRDQLGPLAALRHDAKVHRKVQQPGDLCEDDRGAGQRLGRVGLASGHDLRLQIGEQYLNGFGIKHHHGTPLASMSVNIRRPLQPQAAIRVKLPSPCVLAAGETDIAIRATRNTPSRPAENGLEALAGRLRGQAPPTTQCSWRRGCTASYRSGGATADSAERTART